ncbi:DUF2225 domain-containing protein [Tissierella sp. MSJ-40]|uniref:DUF2225 domain-containing protein n=1 Tax=Tissierella simiarum TaxID=2841534 RepID=A0ABS6E4M2_9FIRM|nr:DUF2225 domain-containing protein [Tissierella simiarum]MBU5437852.1 DUF2225 domain-containing protein [Tissierella simiarum]
MVEAKELYDKKEKCPICEKEFTTKKTRSSKLRLIKRDEDFFNHYSGENPIKYGVSVCPNCGYAALENKFHSITKEQGEIIKNNITTKWNKRSYGDARSLDDAIETYKLALLIGNLLNYKKLEIGTICLSIGWLYRLKEDRTEETRFLTLARDQFKEAYYNESLEGSNMDEGKLSYLAGEISRRLGDKEEALNWLKLSLSSPSTKQNPALDSMAREQWRITKEL